MESKARTTSGLVQAQNQKHLRNHARLEARTIELAHQFQRQRAEKTNKSYDKPQEEYREWCHEHGFADGESVTEKKLRVTEKKLLLFLDECVVNRPIRQSRYKKARTDEKGDPVVQKLGYPSIKRYTASLVDLWKFQKTLERDLVVLDLANISKSHIELTTVAFTSAIRHAIEKTVPWARPSEWSNPDFTPECKEAIKNCRRLRRLHSISDRFLYVDTFKVLSKIHSMECTLYGKGTNEDLDALEKDLDNGLVIDALYTEFPGNPLLQSPDLERLYKLSRKHGFVVVVDDTVTTSINVALFPYCDVICSSLTKMFSGGCNVMGGSTALNPQSPWYSKLKPAIAKNKPEPYFSLDAIVMEINSRHVTERVLKASANTEMVVDMLKDHPAVDQVFYSKGSSSQDLYDRFRRSKGGYGFLVSIRSVTPEAAIAFHDALDVAKGPSLGTNFTLCCAYTLLAHYSELDWAVEYGVVEHLVRISVGIEREDLLRGVINKALAAAEKALAATNGS